MKFTVTGDSGTINWVGETWTLPADSGVTKLGITPDTYTLLNTPSYKRERWAKGTGPGYQFGLNFRYNNSGSIQYGAFACRYKAGSVNDGGFWAGPTGGGFPTTTIQSNYGLGVFLLTTIPAPSASDYRLRTSMFGVARSYTNGDGVVFKWEQDQGW